MMDWIKESPLGITIQIKVYPKSSNNRIEANSKNDYLKVYLKSPPVDGKANRECVQYLSKYLKLRKSDVEIIQGKKSRNKVILLRNALISEIENIFMSGF